MRVEGEGIRNVFPEELTNEMSFEDTMGKHIDLRHSYTHTHIYVYVCVLYINIKRVRQSFREKIRCRYFLVVMGFT